MVVTEIEYNKCSRDIVFLTTKHKDELKHHKSYYGRKKYYPHNLDEWAEIGRNMPKKQSEERKRMEERLKEMRIEIDEHNEKMREAGTKGPQCAVCLENKYAKEGPNVGVSFGPGKCRKHIFHEGCVSDGRLKRCPLCRNDKKKLKQVDIKNLSKLASPEIKIKAKSPAKNATQRKRCPKGTQKNKITGQCDKKSLTKNATQRKLSPTKNATQRKRCPNGTRKNKITGQCDKK